MYYGCSRTRVICTMGVAGKGYMNMDVAGQGYM